MVPKRERMTRATRASPRRIRKRFRFRVADAAPPQRRPDAELQAEEVEEDHRTVNLEMTPRAYASACSTAPQAHLRQRVHSYDLLWRLVFSTSPGLSPAIPPSAWNSKATPRKASPRSATNTAAGNSPPIGPNAARRKLLEHGLQDPQVRKVGGYGDTQPWRTAPQKARSTAASWSC